MGQYVNFRQGPELGFNGIGSFSALWVREPDRFQLIVHDIEVNDGVHIDQTEGLEKGKNRPGGGVFEDTEIGGCR